MQTNVQIVVRSMRALGAAAATLLVAAAVAVLPASPAQAALCSGSGTNVVVSFGAIGGGTQTGCGTGDTAAQVSTSAGFPLSYAARQPGFVCRVKGVPTSDPCVNTSPADAYWGLFWSDGKSATWHYSTLGATAVRVPAGGSVGWAWQDGGARDLPAMAPPVVAKEPAPAPERKPTPKPRPPAAPKPSSPAQPGPSAEPAPRSDGAGRAPTDEAAPTVAAGQEQQDKADRAQQRAQKQAQGQAQKEAASAAPSATPSASTAPLAEESTGATPDVDDDTVPTASSGDADSPGGLPWWVPVGLVVVLGAGAVVAVRRRQVGAGPP